MAKEATTSNPPMVRKINAAGLNLIKTFEGCRLQAYPDPATGGDPWTIGYGHTGKDTYAGRVITQAEADEIFVKDLERFEIGVSNFVTEKLTENQFAALVSFAFNLGLNNLRSSTLLKKLNSKDYSGAADEFLRWNKAAGKVISGLTKRRNAERNLFLTP